MRFPPVPLLVFVAGTLAAAEPETFTIKTLPAQMRYDVTELMTKPGADVKIVFENPDDMPHNMVFFQPGTDAVAVCNQQMERPDEAVKRNWLPEDPRMWLHSKVLNPKEKEELLFKAPEKPGIYPFVCSMPGHAAIMQGRLIVFGPAPQLSNLTFKVYLGDWKKLPDFASLQRHREGELPDKLVELKLDDYKNQFGVVFNGKVKAPSAGEYTFALGSDDGARLSIDGKNVVENDGIHPSKPVKEGKVKLAAGDHEMRLEYFQSVGEAELFAAWKGPGFGMTPLSKWVPKDWKEGAAAKKKDESTGFPLIVEQEPIIYRNFIAGAGNRPIGVGFPGGINIAWNAEEMNLALVWRGAFIDAARHWNGRGGGAQPPLGYDVFHPVSENSSPFAVLLSPGDPWPKQDKGERPPDFQWKGYTLDTKRAPTFFYEWKGLKIAERFEVVGAGAAGSGKLVRILNLTGAIPSGAMFRAGEGSIQPKGDAFLIGGDTKFLVSAAGAQVSGKDLLVPAQDTIKITYSWESSHAHHVAEH